jgi:hypothetical protein
MKTLLVLALCCLSSTGICQSSILVDGRLELDSLYQKSDELLLHQCIIEIPDLKKEELIKRTKNWGGTSFINLKEVMVSETDDQLVFNYIDKSMYMKTMGMTSSYSWYIRLVVQFKDGRMRAQYYDDGNTFQPGLQYGPDIRARQYRLANYFKEDNGRKVAQKIFTGGMVALKTSILENARDLENSVKANTPNKQDW